MNSCVDVTSVAFLSIHAVGRSTISVYDFGGHMGALVGTLLVIIPLWKICARAGFNPALSLIALVPLLGLLIVAGILAFAEWPVSKANVTIQRM